jgi:hypothetical protein
MDNSDTHTIWQSDLSADSGNANARYSHLTKEVDMFDKSSLRKRGGAAREIQSTDIQSTDVSLPSPTLYSDAPQPKVIRRKSGQRTSTAFGADSASKSSYRFPHSPDTIGRKPLSAIDDNDSIDSFPHPTSPSAPRPSTFWPTTMQNYSSIPQSRGKENELDTGEPSRPRVPPQSLFLNNFGDHGPATYSPYPPIGPSQTSHRDQLKGLTFELNNDSRSDLVSLPDVPLIRSTPATRKRPHEHAEEDTVVPTSGPRERFTRWITRSKEPADGSPEREAKRLKADKKEKKQSIKETLREQEDYFKKELAKLDAEEAAPPEVREIEHRRREIFFEADDGKYSYQKATQTHVTSLGELVMTVRVRIMQDGEISHDSTRQYHGPQQVIAELSSSKIDAYLQSHYEDALNMEFRKIDAEIASESLSIREKLTPQPALASSSSTDAAPPERVLVQLPAEERIRLDGLRDEKYAAATKKVEGANKDFLDKYGSKPLDGQLLEELHWVEGKDSASREIAGRVGGSEKKLKANAESLESNATEIRSLLQGIRDITHPPADGASSSYDLFAPRQGQATGHLTVDNFAERLTKLTVDYMNTPHARLSDDFYKNLRTLAANVHSLTSLEKADRIKIGDQVLALGKLVYKRQILKDEPIEHYEKILRYEVGYYGKRLKNEEELLQHLKAESEVAGELGRAEEELNRAAKDAERYYRGAGKTDLRPPIDTSERERLDTSLDTLRNPESDSRQLREAIDYLSSFLHKDRKRPTALQISLEKYEIAQTNVAQAKAKYEQTKAEKEYLQKAVEYAKGRDDSNDALDLKRREAIIEHDKAVISNSMARAQDIMKHIQALELEAAKTRNSLRVELEKARFKLSNLKASHVIHQQYMMQAAIMAFGAGGQQAVVTALGRDFGSGYNAGVQGILR